MGKKNRERLTNSHRPNYGTIGRKLGTAEAEDEDQNMANEPLSPFLEFVEVKDFNTMSSSVPDSFNGRTFSLRADAIIMVSEDKYASSFEYKAERPNPEYIFTRYQLDFWTPTGYFPCVAIRTYLSTDLIRVHGTREEVMYELERRGLA